MKMMHVMYFVLIHDRENELIYIYLTAWEDDYLIIHIILL